MIDFYEGWDLRNRLIKDGYMSEDEDIYDGREMMMKIYELARKYYDWKPAEPSNEEISGLYREFLMQQTANDRIHHIWEIAVDYDGYRSYRGCASLLDEIIGCAQVEVKKEIKVLKELEIFNRYKTCEDFFNTVKIPLCWAFPVEKWGEIEEWCEKNNYSSEFLCFNHNENGEAIAIAIKIDYK